MQYPKDVFDLEEIKFYYENRDKEDELRDINNFLYINGNLSGILLKLYCEYSCLQENEYLMYIKNGFTSILVARQVFKDIHGIRNNRHKIAPNGRIYSIT